MRKLFLKYYLSYVIATSIIWGILSFAYLFSGINCFHWRNPGLNFFLTIGNCAKLATAVVLSIIRYQDPIIKYNVKPHVKKIPLVYMLLLLLWKG